jgi:hypothetical protein
MLVSILLSIVLGTARADTCLDKKIVSRVTDGIRLSLEEKNQNPICEPESHTYKIIETLAAIKGIRFLPKELPRPYNQGILPMGLWKYFAEPTSRVMDAGGHSPNCVDGTIAFVLPQFPDSTVYICPDFYDGDYNLLDRISVLLHEVRHFSGYDHVKCTRGPFLGDEAGCDEALSEKGSYAVSVESLTKMALLEEKFTPLQKEYAKINAISYAESRINQAAAAEHALYLRSLEGKAYYFDGKVLVAAPFVDGTVVSRGEKLAVFPADHTEAYSLNLLSTHLSKDPPAGGTSLQFNQLLKSERPEILDIVWNPKASCSVQAHELSCNVPDVKEDLLVRTQTENKYAFLGDELGLEESSAIYVANEAGMVTKVLLSANGDSAVSTFSSPVAARFKAISLLEGERFGLTKAGEIQVFENGKWRAFPGLAGRRFRSMSRAFDWNSFFYGK